MEDKAYSWEHAIKPGKLFRHLLSFLQRKVYYVAMQYRVKQFQDKKTLKLLRLETRHLIG